MIDTIRAWITAHPYISAYAAIAVVSIALRIAGSTWWAGVKQKHPKLAGLLEVARAIGFDFPKLAQGILRIAYAMLPPPVGGGGGGGTGEQKPPASPPSTSAYRIAVEEQRHARPRPAGAYVGSWALPMMLLLSAVGGITLVGCPSSTPAAKSPAIEQSTAVLVLGARVVHAADVACAAAGKTLREGGHASRAADVTGKCVDALRPAADALDAVATALDAGAAVADKQVTCAIALGVDAVLRVRPVLRDVGVTLPATAETYIKAAAPWIAVAEGMVCKS